MESLDNQRFDLVCCSEVVEHVSNQKEFVQNCTQLVKPGGLFFLSTIAKTPEAYLSNIILGEYIFKLLPKGTHEYNLFVSHDTVEGFIASSFQTIEAKGVTVKNILDSSSLLKRFFYVSVSNSNNENFCVLIDPVFLFPSSHIRKV